LIGVILAGQGAWIVAEILVRLLRTAAVHSRAIVVLASVPPVVSIEETLVPRPRAAA
jgi:hypothetical protein